MTVPDIISKATADARVTWAWVHYIRTAERNNALDVGYRIMESRVPEFVAMVNEVLAWEAEQA